jgi:hypothetical protein
LKQVKRSAANRPDAKLQSMPVVALHHGGHCLDPGLPSRTLHDAFVESSLEAALENR